MYKGFQAKNRFFIYGHLLYMGVCINYFYSTETQNHFISLINYNNYENDNIYYKEIELLIGLLNSLLGIDVDKKGDFDVNNEKESLYSQPLREWKLSDSFSFVFFIDKYNTIVFRINKCTYLDILVDEFPINFKSHIL